MLLKPLIALPVLLTAAYDYAPLALYDGCLEPPTCTGTSRCVTLTDTGNVNPFSYEKTISTPSCDVNTEFELLALTFNGDFPPAKVDADENELQGDLRYELTFGVDFPQENGDVITDHVNLTVFLSNLFTNKQIMIGNFSDGAVNASFQGIGTFNIEMTGSIHAEPRDGAAEFSIDVAEPILSQVCVPKETYQKVIANSAYSEGFLYIESLASCPSSSGKNNRSKIILASLVDSECDLTTNANISSISLKGSDATAQIKAEYIMYTAMGHHDSPHPMPLNECLAVAGGERTQRITKCANKESAETVFSVTARTSTDFIGKAFDGKLTEVDCGKSEDILPSDRAPVPTAAGYILAAVSAMTLSTSVLLL